jgi:hypothetical protein
MNQVLNIADGRKVKVTADSVVVAARDQVSSDLGGESVILDLGSGVYYGLDCIGSAVWQLIQKPVTVGYIRDSLLQEYDVDPARCESELLVFFEQMLGHRLVDVRSEPLA